MMVLFIFLGIFFIFFIHFKHPPSWRRAKLPLNLFTAFVHFLNTLLFPTCSAERNTKERRLNADANKVFVRIEDGASVEKETEPQVKFQRKSLADTDRVSIALFGEKSYGHTFGALSYRKKKMTYGPFNGVYAHETTLKKLFDEVLLPHVEALFPSSEGVAPQDRTIIALGGVDTGKSHSLLGAKVAATNVDGPLAPGHDCLIAHAIVEIYKLLSVRAIFLRVRETPHHPSLSS